MKSLLHSCLLVGAVVFSSACGTRSVIPVAGGTRGWEAEKDYKILSDIKVNSLNVRHVSLKTDLCPSGRKEHLELSGPIGPDSSEVVARILSRLEKCWHTNKTDFYSPVVFLNSSGGFLSDGYALGQIFKKAQVETAIAGGQVCASSCAIAFLGGKHRGMYHDAKLIFHAPYISSGSSIECRSKSESQEMKGYFASFMGAKDGDFLFDRTMSFCSRSEGWAINSDAAKLFGITTQ